MKLKDVGDYFIGLTYRPDDVSDSGIIVLRSGNIQNKKICFDDIVRVDKKIPQKLFVQPGDILMCSRNGSAHLVGKSAVIPQLTEDMTFGAFMTVFRTPINDYLQHFFSSHAFRMQLAAGKTTTINQITISMLDNIEIDIPASVTMYDRCKKLNAITSIIDQRKKELAALDTLIKARFVEMFGTIENNLFGFPIVCLQDVCEQIKDGTHQTPEYTEDTVNGFKFLSSKDVTSGRIDWHHLKYIPKALHDELYARIAPRKGDILLAKNGTTGIAAIVDTDDIFDIYVSLALLRPIDIHSVYLWAAINSAETKRQFDANLKGIGVPNLHLGEIKKAKILLPLREIQNQFAAFVSQVDKSKFREMG